MATRTKKSARKPAAKRAASKRAGTQKRTSRKRASASKPARKGAGGRRRTASAGAASRAARAHAKAADVKPTGSNAAERETSASGRMHSAPLRELRAAKPRPAVATRQQRKKATGEQGFGFKQIEERYTTRGKTGVAGERHETVREMDEELEAEGVGQGRPASGFVDYDKQERTPDETEEEEKVDVVAPAEEE